MPPPAKKTALIRRSDAVATPHTHVATLVNGASYRLVGPAGSTTIFLNSVPKNITSETAEKLKRKAVDRVTQSSGSKKAGKDEPKFKIQSLKQAKASDTDNDPATAGNARE